MVYLQTTHPFVRVEMMLSLHPSGLFCIFEIPFYSKASLVEGKMFSRKMIYEESKTVNIFQEERVLPNQTEP